MPDCQPTEAIEQIRHKASIHPPGIATITCNPQQSQGPLRILWAARWEHDKNPEDFFAAIEILKQRSIEFRLSVIGEQFRDSPSCFEQARQKSAQYIDRWGFQQSRAQYEHALAQADVFVSTANHEFFGISTAEACLAGAYPLLPNRLAYPEILDLSKEKQMQEHFYDGTATALADKLIALASRKKDNALWPSKPDKIRRLAERFQWDRLAPIMDDAVEGMAR